MRGVGSHKVLPGGELLNYQLSVQRGMACGEANLHMDIASLIGSLDTSQNVFDIFETWLYYDVT